LRKKRAGKSKISAKMLASDNQFVTALALYVVHLHVVWRRKNWAGLEGVWRTGV
jgi:hypothetical protein